jgi:hypothetical protein
LHESVELQLPSLGGGWFQLRPFKLPEGIGVAMEDITERREREIQERLRLEFAERLVGIVSHDIRTPLSAISVSAELLARGSNDPAVAGRSIERIQTSSQRAARLVDQMMEWTQASIGGGLPIQRRRVDLLVGLRQTLSEVQAANPGRNFRSNLQGEAWGEWDPDRLAQVFSNLLGNAAQHSPPTSPVLVSATVEDEAVAITVATTTSPGPFLPRCWRRSSSPSGADLQPRPEAGRSASGSTSPGTSSSDTRGRSRWTRVRAGRASWCACPADPDSRRQGEAGTVDRDGLHRQALAVIRTTSAKAVWARPASAPPPRAGSASRPSGPAPPARECSPRERWPPRISGLTGMISNTPVRP